MQNLKRYIASVVPGIIASLAVFIYTGDIVLAIATQALVSLVIMYILIKEDLR